MNSNRWLKPCLVLLTGLLISTALVSCSSDDDDSTVGQTEKLTVGVLLTQSGGMASLGETALAAVQYAVADLNASLAGSGKQVRALVGNTETDPDIAEAMIGLMQDAEIRIIVGPMSSAEMERSLGAATDAGILLIGQSSTDPDLAIANDNLFRLVPSDEHQAKAIAAKMYADGIRYIVSTGKVDSWATHLEAMTVAEFTTLGGTAGEMVVLGEIRDNDFRDSLAVVESMVQAGIDQYGAGAVAVYMLSFDEGTDILGQASELTTLSNVRWYGTDGYVNNNVLFDSTAAAEFAVAVSFTSPVFVSQDGAKYESIVGRLEDDFGYTPSIYAVLTYDAVTIAANTLLAANGDEDISALRSLLAATITGTTGASGTFVLNAAGDRANGGYGFWQVEEGGAGGYVWTLAGTSTIE